MWSAVERQLHYSECQRVAGALHRTRSVVEGTARSVGECSSEWRGHCTECGRMARALHGVRMGGGP